MNLTELISSNITNNLVDEIQSMNLDSCSNDELVTLRNWIAKEKQHADYLTLENEVVGYTYNNLRALTPKVISEESKRGIQLVKTMNF